MSRLGCVSVNVKRLTREVAAHYGAYCVAEGDLWLLERDQWHLPQLLHETLHERLVGHLRRLSLDLGRLGLRLGTFSLTLLRGSTVFVLLLGFGRDLPFDLGDLLIFFSPSLVLLSAHLCLKTQGKVNVRRAISAY